MSKPAEQLKHPALTGIPEFEGNRDDGLEILVDLAKSGRIDPWNVDITLVADQFLKAVTDMQVSDLKLTGKTLLYLAVLLRMKSDMLQGQWYLEEEPLDEEAGPDWELDNRDAFALKKLNPFRSARVVSLEEALQRRTSIKQPRIRRVTLEDLISELKKVEAQEQEKAFQEKVKRIDNRRVRDFSTLTADDIVELAHEEFVEDTVDILSRELEAYFIAYGPEAGMPMTQLQELTGIDPISVYLGSLTLASRGQIRLDQPAFYGPITLYPDEPILDAAPDGEPLEEAS